MHTANMTAPLSLRPDQQARRSDRTARALHVILDEARNDREDAALAFAVADADTREEALRGAVAASGAVDAALHALTSYVVYGFAHQREVPDPDDTPLHERCRLARNAIAGRVAEVFAAREAS